MRGRCCLLKRRDAERGTLLRLERLPGTRLQIMFFSKAATFAFGGFLELWGGQTYSFSDYSEALQVAPLSLT